MAEQLAFSRTASGLVRGLSMYDAFGIGLMIVQPIYGIWAMIMLGLGLFPGGNLVIAIIISSVMCGIGSPLVWGMLGGSMPRSGGEYVFNSRIINPVIATGASMAQLIAGIYWQFFISCWIAVPALSMLAQYMGWNGLAEFALSKWGTFLCAASCIVIGFLTVAFGMRVYKMVQKPLVVLAIGGPLVLAIALSLATRTSFVNYWNELAAQYGSLDFNSFTKGVGDAAGAPIPTTWNWSDTFGCMTGVFMLFVYNYFIVYVGGEIKRPDKSILGANVLTVVVSAGLGLWTVLALNRVMGASFLSAAAYNDLVGGVAGYTFPYPSSYMTLSWIASNGNWFIAVMACLSFITIAYLEVTLSIMGLSRIWFAWGMDRMGPKWFTDISSRWASPVKSMAIMSVIFLVGTACYVLWFTSALTGLAAAGMQLVSLFVITGISAIILPYRKKVRTVWESSPYRTWKILGVPVITIAGVLYVAYILILIFYAFIYPRSRDLTGKNLITFGAAWALGIAWFYFWKFRNKRAGVDTSVVYGQLPPD